MTYYWSYDLLLFIQNESNERRDLELWLTTIPTEWIKWEKRSGVMTYYYSYRMNFNSYRMREKRSGVMTYYYSYRMN